MGLNGLQGKYRKISAQIILKTTIRYVPLLIFALVGIWTLEWPLSMPWAGLDPSWIIGINKAVSDNLQFGPDIAFTYGPLGFLWYPVYIDPALWFLSLAYTLFIHFLFLFSLAMLMAKSSANWKEYLVVFVAVLVPIHFSFIRETEELLSAGIFLYLIVEHKFNRTHEMYILSFVSLLLAITAFIKNNIALAGLSIIIAFLLICILRKELKKYLYVFILYFTFIPVLWIIAGQHLINLPLYLFNNYQLSSGYNDAMATDGPVWQVYAGLIGIIFIIILFIYSLIKRTDNLVMFILLNSGVLFLTFKHGFIRHSTDGYQVYGFFAYYAIIFVIVYIISKDYTKFAWRAISLLISILFIASIYNGFPDIMGDNVLQKLPAYEVSISLISNQPYQNQLLQDAKNNLRNDYPLDNKTIQYLKTKSIDVFAWDVGLVWAYNFNWSPRPVFQSYSAYTDYLDNLNSQHFSNEKAPQSILYSYKSIDERYPIFDEPATFSSILNNYSLIGKSNEFLLLSYTPKKNSPIEKDLGTVKVKLGQPITIPKYDAGFLFAHVKLEYSPFGKFMKLVYKPAQAHVRFKFSDSSYSYKFRFIPGVSKNGIFISQYVINNDDLASIFEGNITQNITEMIIDVDSPADYKNYLEVKFVGIPANISERKHSD